MKKIILIICMILLSSIVSAHQHDFSETKQIIDSGISCDKLTDEQLEAIGDYYMEQMHPGEAHDIMDKMMGGEGSESLRQTHITMAKSIYCNEGSGMMDGSMMNMMMGNNMMGSGMMGNWGYGFGYNLISILYIILLIGLIILVYVGIIKLWKSMKNKGSRR